MFGFGGGVDVFQLEVQRHISPQPVQSRRNKSDTQKRKKESKSKDKLEFLPSGFMIDLVFQLPDFLFNDAHLLSVNKHCVLLESTYSFSSEEKSKS